MWKVEEIKGMMRRQKEGWDDEGEDEEMRGMLGR